MRASAAILQITALTGQQALSHPSPVLAVRVRQRRAPRASLATARHAAGHGCGPLHLTDAVRGTLTRSPPAERCAELLGMVVTSEESGDLKRLERDYQPTRVTENWTALNAAGVSQQARSSSPSPRPSGDPRPEGGS